jgi:hypothetical protein
LESIAPTILYKENVLVAMDHPLPPNPSEFSEPFWLATRFSIGPTDLAMTKLKVILEDFYLRKQYIG